MLLPASFRPGNSRALVGPFTDPHHLIRCTSNDEIRQELAIMLVGRAVGGEPITSSESSEAQWIELTQRPELQMDRSMRMRLARHERCLARGPGGGRRVKTRFSGLGHGSRLCWVRLGCCCRGRLDWASGLPCAA